ncbi:hypothetical protein [Paenibacillus pinihumi]|uniref:hypothetical protein n=1 Tax=Paenibacillus pinihumi TaxID=669462 RepID=UPI000407C951|nr:hypothetical protein [Paenibacillus pinihumi]
MTKPTFRGRKDHTAEFERAVTDIINNFIVDRGERVRAVGALIDEYVAEVGGRPKPAQLERLTDYLLYEDLEGDRRTNKTTDEYPVLSERQLARREDYEYSIDLADGYDTDGRNRTKPARRHRIAREERFVDKLSRQKNRARNEQYRRDTSPGPVTADATEPFVQARQQAARWRESLSVVY